MFSLEAFACQIDVLLVCSDSSAGAMLATLVREVCAISDSFWFKMAGIVDSEAHFESRAIEYGYDVKGFILPETSK